MLSLCHLAVTCHLLRDVARSLLYNRGLVSLHWQKSRQGWDVTHYVIICGASYLPYHIKSKLNFLIIANFKISDGLSALHSVQLNDGVLRTVHILAIT